MIRKQNKLKIRKEEAEEPEGSSLEEVEEEGGGRVGEGEEEGEGGLVGEEEGEAGLIWFNCWSMLDGNSRVWVCALSDAVAKSVFEVTVTSNLHAVKYFPESPFPGIIG